MTRSASALPVPAAGRRPRPAASLALLLVLLAGCTQAEPGSLALRILWQPPPAEPLFVWARVEQRPLAEQPGPILASTGPALFQPGQPLELRMGQVPNGTGRRVVVEARRERDLGSRVLYYGVSEPFGLQAGEQVTVAVPLALGPPGSERLRPRVELLFGGEPRTSVRPDQARDATVRTRSKGADTLVLANDLSFSAGLRTLPLDDPALRCTPEPDPAEPELPWRRCDLSGWDLLAGLQAEPPDGPVSVFVKFVDPHGYASAALAGTVLLDRLPPQVLAASVSPRPAAADDTILLTVTLHEPLAQGADAARLSGGPGPAGEPGPILHGPERVADSNTYLWQGPAPAGDPGTTYGLELRVADAVDNRATLAPLSDELGEPLQLVVDTVAPALEEPEVTTLPLRQDAAGRALLLVGPRDRLQVVFRVAERGELAAGYPALELAAPEPVAFDEVLCVPGQGRREGQVCTASLQVADEAAAAPAEGRWPVRVLLEDEAGNRPSGDGLLSGVSVQVDLSAPPTECLLNLEAARLGQTLRVLATFGEPLGGQPELRTEPPALAERFTLRAVGDVDSDSSPSWYWELPLDEAPEEGGGELDWSWRVYGVDRAGNPRVERSLCAGVGRIDARPITVSPPSPDQGYLNASYGGRQRGVFARDGSSLEVRYHLDERPAPGAQRLSVGGVLQRPDDPGVQLVEQELPEGGWEHRWSVQVQPERVPGAGPLPVVLVVADAAGNVTSAALGLLLVDRRPPELLGSPLFTRQDPGLPGDDGSPTWQELAPTAERRARLGPSALLAQPQSRVTVGGLRAAEPLAQPPAVLTPWGELVAHQDGPAGDDVGLPAYVAHVLLPAQLQPGPEDLDVSLRVRLEDRAGNTAEQALGSVRYDGTPPAAMSAAGLEALMLHREPWGSEARPGVASTELLLCLDPTEPGVWSWCVGAAAPVGVDALVRVYPAAAAAANDQPSCDDTLLAEADLLGFDGSARVLDLGADRLAVCVTSVDRAGNESGPALVPRVQWLASLAGLEPGSAAGPPHSVHTAGVFWERRVHGDGAVARRGATLAAADGDTLTTHGAGSWARLNWAAPAARHATALAHDSARGRTVAFGGVAQGQQTLEDTWEWDGRAWRQMWPLDPEGDGDPPARSGHGLAYDTRRERTVLFGSALDAHVWEWDGRSWARRVPTTDQAPSPRVGAAVAWDPVGQRTLVFGGLSDGLQPLAELWAWDGDAWSRLDAELPPDAPAPPARLHAALACSEDPGEGCLLFGGLPQAPAQPGAPLGDLWRWDGDGWEALAPAAPNPAARSGHALASDPLLGRILLFGGQDAAGPLADTWSWAAGAWTPLGEPASPDGRPAARWSHGLVFDRTRHLAVVYAGTSLQGEPLADTWLLGAGGWQQAGQGLGAGAVQLPGQRPEPALATNSSSGAVTLHGASDELGSPPADLWELGPLGWTALPDGGGGPGEGMGQRMADVGAEGLLLFGGLDAEGGLVLGTWAWRHQRWEQVAPPGLDQPPPRWGHTLSAGLPPAAALLHGGVGLDLLGGETLLDDLWAWSGGRWHAVPTGGQSPGARSGAAMVVWPGSEQVLLFGGGPLAAAAPPFNDTWAWDGARWALLSPDGPPGAERPPARRRHALVGDPLRETVLLFGGDSASGGDIVEELGDVWEWTGQRWEAVAVADPEGDGSPAARAGHALAWDPGRDGAVLHGGLAPGRTLDSTWLWDGGATTRPAQQVTFALPEQAFVGGAQVELCELSVLAGAAGSLDGAWRSGARLLVWRDGRWQLGAARDDGVDEAGQPRLGALGLSVGDPEQLQRMLAGPGRRLSVAVVPVAPNGGARALVVSDYVAALLRYRL